jgi:hypothetical protein
VIVALLLLTGSLASWYSPWGWVAWGPRLMLPVLPAAVIVVLVVFGERLESTIRAMARHRVILAVVGVAVIALSLPQVNILHDPAIVGSLFTPDATCPRPASVLETNYYYHCLSHYAWGRAWLLRATYTALDGAWGRVFAVVFAAAWAGMIAAVASGVRLRSSAAGALRPPPPAHV